MGFVEDARHAVRGLRRDPLLILAATLTLAVSIGASTTVFSIANSILIRPLPYPAAERIDCISERSGPAQQDIGVAEDYPSAGLETGFSKMSRHSTRSR